MASEPSDEPVSVSLPPEIAEWIDQQAADRDTDRETVLVQLLAAHQATEEFDDGTEIDADLLARTTDLEDEVRDIIAGRLSDIAGAVADRIDVEQQVQAALDDQVAAAVDEQVSAAVDEHLAETLDERATDLAQTAAEQASQQLQSELQSVESDFVAKIEDVRDRVIQVKKETDQKAPADHEHEALDDRISELAAETEEIAAGIDDLRADFDAEGADYEERLDEVDETVQDMQEKLRTVAYVVRDLRENAAFDNKRDTSVEQLKRTAAEHDVERARCEACGQGVAISLLTEPECPHCNATVTDVTPGTGFFGKPELVKAQGIEAASDGERQ
ncbi:hypothetical protein ACFR9U_01035 [Halorientalis brevis]|uniref:CopG family transcriptional regulator n=1 Tax=Halorientalis brevis TaxID=1126241 RepID=A0ABD6C686_9EURY|nr:hypothetical protein [Halorientalis brevis]